VGSSGTRKVLDALADAGWTFATSVPDKGIADLLQAIDGDRRFIHIACTREEEAIGLCAGAAFAGRRGVVLTQNSGVGNTVNALTSLMGFYDLPLLMLVSQRGGAQERIAAQRPMGQATRPVLEASGVRAVDVFEMADLAAAIGRASAERVAAIGEPDAWARILS
jgi:sulfopyruvate decarboxylase subunit alpha